MYHYLFTNDLRITNLQSALTKAGHCFVTNTVPSAEKNKNDNNNMNTLGFYFNLTNTSKCAVDCSNGHVRKIVLNFIKKFQFPNPRTSDSMNDAIHDGITLAPMRVVLQVLYTMNMFYNEAFLTREEIKNFIFFNSAIAKTKTPNIVDLIQTILEFRKTGQFPNTVERNVNNIFWKQDERQIREMLKILTWSGCVSEDDKQSLYIHHDSLTEQNKAALFDILTYNGYWDPDTSKTYAENKASYQIYMDVEECDDSLENEQNSTFTPEWFAIAADKFSALDIEADQLYKDFRAKYGPEALKAVDGKDLLHKIFINETRDKENLCYVLEFDKQFSQFGGIGGGSAYKYGLYFNADKQSWMTGSSRNPKNLSLEDAIALGTTIRNEILAGVKIIEDAGELTELKDYAELNTKLYEVMPTTINKKWVIKYFHMLFPQLFPPFYNDEWQNKVLTAIDEEPDGNSFVRMGQIALFVKKCGISTLAFSKVIYNLDSLGEIEDNEEPVVENALCTFESEIKNGKNVVVYGTPGCGKSYYVQNTLLKAFDVSNDEQHRIRTTFYQDYTNTDFVGQIIPKVKEDKSVTYEFNPGPFALAMKMAIERPNEPVALVIEELNRGNAASIFGDIFQLLDRTEEGKSQYKITNVNLQDYLNKVFKDKNIHFDYIVIPSNLYIVATMNTSDQNVFTLDTAFKRRWKFEKLPNVFAKDHEYAEYYVPGMTGVTWRHLVDSINRYIVKNADELSSEDKQLGVYFIGKETLCKEQTGETDVVKKKEFAYKLLEYLWDDVAKYNHVDWFGPDIKTLDQLIVEYMEKGQKVFIDEILG
jgi:hypothetical protein